jgi:hypothetical protein
MPFCVDQLEANSVGGTCIRKVLTCTLLLGHARVLIHGLGSVTCMCSRLLGSILLAIC